MGLRETDTVDIIASGPEGEVILVACDTIPMLDHNERLRLLMLKLQTYAAYARSDTFAEKFPGKTLQDVKFLVTCDAPPTPRMYAIKWFPVTEDHTVPLEFKHIPEGFSPRACSHCGQTGLICSELRECVFSYEETDKEETYVLSCQLCQACGLFVPSSPPDDGRPECGEIATNHIFSEMSTYTFTYPQTGEQRRHTLLAMKCRKCQNAVVLGAARPAQQDAGAN